jgi:hypothetical protein
MALAALNFFDMYYFFICFATMAICISINKKIQFDLTFLLLMLFSISLLIFNNRAKGSIQSITKQLVYPMCYLIGLNIMNASNDLNDCKYKKYMIVLAYATLGHAIMNMFYNFQLGYVHDRDTYDIWTKNMASATGQAMLFCIFIGCLPSFLLIPDGKLERVCSLIGFVLLLAYALILAGRTIFILIAISMCIYLAHYFAAIHGSERIKKIMMIAACCVIAIFAYTNNLLGVKDFAMQSNLYKRFFDKNAYTEINEDPRMDRKIYYLQHMLEYPFGGLNLREHVGYAHDLFLDTYDEFGIFAFIFLVVFVLHSSNQCLLIIKDKNVSKQMKLLILGIYSTILVQFMFEPILQGAPWLFSIYCFSSGMIGRIKHNSQYIESLAM